jgi:hypothetical protein
VRERRLGPRPADQPLIDGEAAEHAARRLVARKDRHVLDPRTRERVRALEPARPAADDDDVVVAGREGTLADHALAFAEHLLVEGVRDRLELRAAEVGEER